MLIVVSPAISIGLTVWSVPLVMTKLAVEASTGHRENGECLQESRRQLI